MGARESRRGPGGRISPRMLVALLALLGVLLLAAACDTGTDSGLGGDVSDSGQPPASTSAPSSSPQGGTGGLTVALHWHGSPGQSCTSNCGSGRVHAPWKLSYQCPADAPGVGGYGLAFQLQSSDGSSSQVDAPNSCAQGQVQWWSDYDQMPTVGSGATLTITEVDCPDPRPFGVAANPPACDLWIWQG